MPGTQNTCHMSMEKRSEPWEVMSSGVWTFPEQALCAGQHWAVSPLEPELRAMGVPMWVCEHTLGDRPGWFGPEVVPSHCWPWGTGARLLSLSACVFLKGDLSLAAEEMRVQVRLWPSFRSVLAFGGLVTSPRFHCFKTASRVGAWGCHLLALGRYFHLHFWLLFIQRPSGTHSAIFLESPPAASHN